jgi:hypothetical protein
MKEQLAVGTFIQLPFFRTPKGIHGHQGEKDKTVDDGRAQNIPSVAREARAVGATPTLSSGPQDDVTAIRFFSASLLDYDRFPLKSDALCGE